MFNVYFELLYCVCDFDQKNYWKISFTLCAVSENVPALEFNQVKCVIGFDTIWTENFPIELRFVQRA